MSCSCVSHPRRLTLNARNPLRLDPTRTTSIRSQFGLETRKRFGALRRAVREFIAEKDALGLGERRPGFTLNVQPREYEFLTDTNKVQTFRRWFEEQVQANVLSSQAGTPVDRLWTTTYVESAYKRGMLNSYLSTKQDVPLGPGLESSQAFLSSSFNQPEAMSKVQLLGTRAWEGMRGVSATMGAEMNRILAQGIADGRGPADLAREMTDRIDELTRTRAMTIARTETIHAHAEGQLDAFQRLEVKELGLQAEWSTAGDDRVCGECQGYEGRVFSVEESRGMIPLHPNCRCSWIPYLPPKKVESEKESKTEVPPSSAKATAAEKEAARIAGVRRIEIEREWRSRNPGASSGDRAELSRWLSAMPNKALAAPARPNIFWNAEPGGAHYLPQFRRVVVAPISKTGKGGRATFFHEFGHSFHDSKQIVTDTLISKEFKLVIDKSRDRLKDLEKSLALAQQRQAANIRKWKARVPGISGYQGAVFDDIAGGLTKGRIGSGHELRYFSKKNNGAMEVFANTYQEVISTGGDKLREVFPELVDYMRKLIL